MEEEKKAVEEQKTEQKKSKLPIILLVLVLLIGVGCGGYFLVKKANNKPKDDTKTEEKKDDKVAYGDDKNTTGLKILDTKTKNITLNGKEYELKIEILEGKITKKDIPADASDVDYRENVYINGYQFINNQDVYDAHVGFGEEDQKNIIYKSIDNQFDDAKILKDTNGKDEYLVFYDIYNNGLDCFMYIINTKGEVIAKIMEGSYSLGFNVSSKTKIDKEIDYIECNDNIGCTAKYYVYGYKRGLTQVKEDYILFLPIQNVDEAAKKLLESDYNSSKIELEENKLSISNGKISNTKATIFKGSDGYIFDIAGAGYVYPPDDIVKPAE